MRAEQNPCLFPINQPPNLSRFRGWWERFKRSRRAKDLYWLWLFAAGLFAVGLVGDFYAWWDKWGYLGNIVAGATGALFGIPVAATVIQWLVRKESEWTSKRDIVTVAWRTLKSIHRSLALLNADRALGLHLQVAETLADFTRLNPHNGEMVYPTRQELDGIIGDYRTTLRQITEFQADSSLGAESESIRNRYRLLSEQVFMQAEALDMVIISDDLRGRLVHVTSFSYPGTLLTEETVNSPFRDQDVDALIDQAFDEDEERRESARDEIGTYLSYLSMDLFMTQQTLESIDRAWRIAQEAYAHLDGLKTQFD